MLFGPVPAQERTGHLDLVPGRRIAGCPLLLAFLGGGRQDGVKGRRYIPPTPPNCMCVCVCVCCVSPLTLCVISACRVANKAPDVLSDYDYDY